MTVAARKKMPREIRLAYLCHLLMDRIKRGRATVAAWNRRYRLVLALEQEKNF